MTSKAFKPAMSANARLKAISNQLTKAGDMEGKVIAITGAASGIGFALAKILAIRGAKVSMADANQVNLYKAVHELQDYARSSDFIWAQQVDVRKQKQLENWISQTVERFGKLDGAANIAGIIDQYLTGKEWHEESNEAWDRVLAVNLTGLANSMKAELKVMKKGGAIVNCASVAGIVAKAGTVPYIAAKHGVVGLTKSIARKYGPESGLRVNAVAPGFVSTALLAGVEGEPGVREIADQLVAGVPIPRRADAEEAAKVFAFLLSDDASYVTGAVYTVDGGMTA